MKVKVTKEFDWAPDGNHVRRVKAGTEVEGRAAEVALQLSSGEKVAEAPKSVESTSKPAAPILGKGK